MRQSIAALGFLTLSAAPSAMAQTPSAEQIAQQMVKAVKAPASLPW